MKLTMKKALEECAKLWRYLAEHPECDDKQEAAVALRMRRITRYENECPCCQYASQFRGAVDGDGIFECNDADENCPLYTIWGGPERHYPCEEPGSPYRLWSEAHTKKDRKKYARIIAGAAENMLAKGVEPYD